MTDQTDIAAAHLDLGELIRALETEDPTMRVPLGFDNPHSYRGYYHELAFEPARNVRIGAMLEAARSALGATYTGYKGGDYLMTEHTGCWLAHYGDTGETIGRTLLRALLAPGRPALPVPTAADVPEGLSYADVIAQKVADELDRREQAACDRAAAEFDTAWDSVGGRPVEVAGSPDNLAALDRLLTGWRCCTAPASCGARCQDDELSDVLARAARLVGEKTAAPAPAASEEQIPPPDPDGVLGWIADRVDARRWPLAEHGYPAHLHGIDDGTAVLDLLPADADFEHAWEDLPDPVVSYRITLAPMGPAPAETSAEAERRQMACPMTHLPEMPCGTCGKPVEVSGRG